MFHTVEKDTNDYLIVISHLTHYTLFKNEK